MRGLAGRCGFTVAPALQVLVVATATLFLASPLAGQQPVPEGLEPVPPEACRSEGESRIPLLAVGSYHMANPGLDAFNLDADPVTTPRRQREIEAVVSALEAFRPTRVAIEARQADQARWQERYAAWRRGEHELATNEREQIGFRLADRAGHDSIHAVDVEGEFPMDPWREAAREHPRYRELGEGLQRSGRRAMELLGSWLEEGTVGEMLWRMNTPAALRANHRLYLEFMLPVATSDGFPGARLVEAWYGRNLRIFSLLQNLADEGDRVVVLFGQGHIPLFRRFAADDPRFCVADPLAYLEEARTVDGE